MSRFRHLSAVALGAALLAAGCGGEDEPAAVGWADDFCSSLTTWTDSVQAATQTLTSGDADRVETAVDDLRDATRQLADDLESLGAPETDAGAEAKASLDTLAESLRDDLEEIEGAASDAEGASGLLTAISTISATLVAMGQATSETLEELEQLDGRGELADAFEQADSCQELESR
jgi:hypothetical protein